MTNQIEHWLFKCFQKVIANTAKGKATILTYHKVSDVKTPFAVEEVSIKDFQIKMRMLKKYFNVLPLAEVLEAAKHNEIPPYTVAITVDDGYQDCYSVITPILDELGLSGTFFIATEGIDSGGLWNDKIAFALLNTKKKTLALNCFDEPIVESVGTLADKHALYQRLIVKSKYMNLVKREQLITLLLSVSQVEYEETGFLTKENINAMHNAGMEIGAHTHRHPILSMENDNVASDEIEQSKLYLEKIVDAPVRYFAYPNGLSGRDFDIRHEKMVKSAGFEAAFSTTWGHLTSSTNMFSIPRFTPWEQHCYAFSYRLVRHFRKFFK